MPSDTKMRKLSDYAVFFDFDNTITSFDVLDDIIRRFSIDKNWVALEKLWKKGVIGSKVCLQGQLQSVRVSKDKLSRYLSKIKVASHFNKLVGLLKRKGIKPVILSDDFSFVIESILKTNRIKGLKIYSNKIRFSKERLIPSFPYTNRHCQRCAHCKKKHLIKSNAKGKIIVYIGDGLSDICPAQKADILFAKGELLKYFHKKKKKKLTYIPYRGHKDIYNYFRRLEN